ncbi:TetR/AcrR family transcriptional regulator [Roseibacillus persicicus]|uniref:TetR family transcriptional regulator n=1 Tax=Roseibacillus persicicus TaxID=454148 RepID=A0A918TH49_9BACT|nr:TetR/AcrR family transcriptional regulator [Roseibacillus persicicus]MDQ8191191.1 TetR/AcrR family transcriptional regulator [Roseibacillus persicicus]GHC48168.1 TetR family transcriptional regulator [Roseibacillus persicicus]
MQTERDGTETRERLLDAAEALFAGKGFEAVSLREITTAAEANVAAVNYHFGSKDKLITAVMVRHAVPINQERMRRLEALLSRKKKPSVREVAEAFLRPMMERILERDCHQALFAKFMARMTGEGANCLPSEVVPQFREMSQMVVEAFQQAVPGMTTEQAYCRMKFCFAVVADALMRDGAFEQISEGRLDAPLNWDFLFEEVVNFCVGGLKG